MFYNTLSRRREEFVPQVPGEVKIYACGPTVYDYFHVGNARAFVVFDTLRRVLLRRGFKVTFVQNITDIDDKIINRANREGRKAADVAEEFTRAFQEDVAALGNLPAEVMPRATEHMPEIIAWVEKLVESRHAYVIDGDVYFAVRSFAAYGKVSGKNIEELEEGARVEVDPRKRDPLDFALWKTAKPGEPAWESPWGPGRPGWHIECSVMSMKYLGESFDIHGGGEDLIFPHHENENAQSEVLTGKPLARLWLHNGHLKIDGEKMSKSLDNFWVLRDILKQYLPQVIRLFLLSAHYRSALDFTHESVASIQESYQELYWTIERLKDILKFPIAERKDDDPENEVFKVACQQAYDQFERFLDDDFNTAGATGQIYTLANIIKKFIADKKFELSNDRQKALINAQQKILEMLSDFGIELRFLNKPEEVKRSLDERWEARIQKNWAEADRLRQAIELQGWRPVDTPMGPCANSTVVFSPNFSLQSSVIQGSLTPDFIVKFGNANGKQDKKI
jgi:cysteinyl-tRNA synthetase